MSLRIKPSQYICLDLVYAHEGQKYGILAKGKQVSLVLLSVNTKEEDEKIIKNKGDIIVNDMLVKNNKGVFKSSWDKIPRKTAIEIAGLIKLIIQERKIANEKV